MKPSNCSKDILIVDDNANNLKLLAQILTDHGYGLRAVTSGKRALDSVAIDPPDLILLDIRMPGLDGFEVCRQLKSNPDTKDIPVIFISALDEIGDKVKAFESGGVDYITKPFQMEEVIARVETHLSLCQLQQQLKDANLRMEKELKFAGQVQASFMPKILPDLPGWQIAAHLQPAKETSGDFYDVMRLPGGGVGFLIADVVDKGVGAALFMAMCCALLRTSALDYPGRPEQVFQEVNQRILEYTNADQFVTVFLGVLNPRTGWLCYSNAGHNPPILVKSSQENEGLDTPVSLLRNTGAPLGILEEGTWLQRQVQLQPEDVLLLYTDGVTEAENIEREFFSMERLTEIVCQNRGQTATEIQANLLDQIHEFTINQPQLDDMAIMIVKRG